MMNMPIVHEQLLTASLAAMRGRLLQECEAEITSSGLDWQGYWPEIDHHGEITGRITDGKTGGTWRGVSVQYGQIALDNVNATAMQLIHNNSAQTTKQDK
jgi:hypothetical protein